MSDTQKPEDVISGEVVSMLTLQKQLDDTEAELMQVEKFKQFIELRKTVNDKMAEIRKNVEAVMVPAYQAGEVDKSIKGDWGSITVKENDEFDIDEKLLPKDYWKKVPNMTLIRGKFQLEGKVPKGAKHIKKYGIMMKFK